jgi:hypothetical protein
MAGDWIKMRSDLATDPAVIAIAAKTGLDEFGVVGRLHSLWAWADSQTLDGNAVGVTESFLDRYLGVTGMARAMVSVGWLEVNSCGLKIPHFDRHNGQTAKARALTAKRVAKFKDQKGNGYSVTQALPREEKRREELIQHPQPPVGGSKVEDLPEDPTLSEVRRWIGSHKKLMYSEKLFRPLHRIWTHPSGGQSVVAECVDAAIAGKATQIGPYAEGVFNRRLASSGGGGGSDGRTQAPPPILKGSTINAY